MLESKDLMKRTLEVERLRKTDEAEDKEQYARQEAAKTEEELKKAQQEKVLQKAEEAKETEETERLARQKTIEPEELLKKALEDERSRKQMRTKVKATCSNKKQSPRSYSGGCDKKRTCEKQRPRRHGNLRNKRLLRPKSI